MAEGVPDDSVETAGSVDLSPEWEAVQSMGRKRRECAAVVHEHYIYTFGGIDGRGVNNTLETVERLDVSTWRWESVESMHSKRRGCATVVVGEHIYAIGGYDGNTSLETVERMNVSTGHWEMVESMHSKRRACAAVVHGLHIYAIGGFDGYNTLETVERMNVSTGQWEAVEKMHSKRFACAAAVDGQHIYAIGGYDISNVLQTVERLDLYTGQWEDVESMRSKRWACAAVVHGQHIYVVGGYDGSDNLETMERMQVSTGRWEVVKSMPSKRRECAAVVQGLHIYAIGGYDGGNSLDTVVRIHVSSEQWELVESMHSKRGGCAAAVQGHHIYAIGGIDGRNVLQTVERLDVLSGQWEAVMSMHSKRRGCAAVVHGQHLYAIGGFDDNNTLETVERMDVLTERWEEVGSMRSQRLACAAVVHGEHIYAIGGFDDTNILGTVERLDVSTGQWETVESMLSTRYGCAAVVHWPHIYAIGGFNGDNTLGTVERMDMLSGRWEAVGSLKSKRGGCAAVVEGGRIHAIGGYDDNNILETVECMEVSTGRWEEMGSMRSKRLSCGAVVHGQHIYAIGGQGNRTGINSLDTAERYLIPVDTPTVSDGAHAAQPTSVEALQPGQPVDVEPGCTPEPSSAPLLPVVSPFVSLGVLYHELCTNRGLPAQRGTSVGASGIPADLHGLLERLESHTVRGPAGSLRSEALKVQQDRWAAAQRAVRVATSGLEAGIAQLPEEVRQAGRHRDCIRVELACVLQEALRQGEEWWAAAGGLREHLHSLQKQIEKWHAALRTAGAQGTQTRAMDAEEATQNGVPAASLPAGGGEALTAFQAWQQDRYGGAAQLAEASDGAVAAVRAQFQALFDFPGIAAPFTAPSASMALAAALQGAQAALEAERKHQERQEDPPPREGIVAAGMAALAELQAEEAAVSRLAAMQSLLEELRGAEEAVREGRVAAAAGEIRAANRQLRKQRLHLGELRRAHERHLLELEEEAEEAPGEDLDRSVVEEASAQVTAKKAEVEAAQQRVHAATSTLVRLERQFPEVICHMEHGVPPELLPLWRPDWQKEDFVEYNLQTRQGTRHEVWRARDALGQQFAVKEYPISQDDPGALKVLWREASLLHRVRHPAIAPILALFLSHQAGNANVYGLQMPWFEHGQLDEWLTAQEPGEGAVRRGMLRVLEAVAHLHRARVLHCDIKPANILVDSAGRPHLLDFDISVDATTRTSVTYLQETTLRGARGTEGYMAPEMARTGPTPATDMFAFGVTLAAVAPPEEQCGAELCELLQALTSEDPAARPSASEACQHPYFTPVWEWKREEMRQCCMRLEHSACGGARHSLSGGVECANRFGAPHFVCARCLAAHALQVCEERDGRVRCPCSGDPSTGCESCDYTDLELAQHLRPAEYERYIHQRQQALRESMQQEVQAQQAEVVRQEMVRLRECKLCLSAEANAIFMD
ncbi:hypothetical protein CYMTET_15622 [Cymbomonas tetramitiformis]|uniref:Protein kinase domain-containing protein n=1 Tax=Cymbomonas tetramitiformis TaxID=36881 RepID=A0AAE0GE73_9CHLO|nr:hypothetical protein CYMTET_15622 [Cymbomonas tetramitiformis]